MMLHEAARGWIGSPFRHQGRAHTGIDCVGLLVLACSEVGFAIDDFTAYGRDPHLGLLEHHLRRVFGAPGHALEPGCVVACAFPVVTRHVAIVGDYVHGGLSLIHTWNRVGRVIEHRLDERWRRRITGVYRLEQNP